jgi:hypothetical protein
MTLKLFDRVRVTTDRYAADGARLGDVGYIVEVYDDGAFEVEISATDGSTVAIFAAQPDEVEAAPERD